VANFPFPLSRVPHISLVFREMWNSANVCAFCNDPRIGTSITMPLEMPRQLKGTKEQWPPFCYFCCFY
jgi:hypothetical protein